MQVYFRPLSARALFSALLVSGTTLVLAAGCGGGGDSSPSPSAGSGGDAGDNGDGGSSAAGKGGKGSAGKSGAPTGEEAGAGGEPSGEGGAGGEGVVLPPAQNNSAVAFVSAGRISKSKNFILISGLGESLGGTVGSKQSKSLKYTYIPGVIAASSP